MTDLTALTPDQLAIALDGPALQPPDGVIPNFVNPSNRNGLAHATLALCLSFATVFFLMRLYIRFIYMKKHYLEDYLLIAAYGLFVGFISRGYFQLGFTGFYVHQWDIRLRDFFTLLHLYLVSNSLHLMAVGLLKVAILLDWIRIFVPVGTRNAFFWTCHVVMWVNILWHIAAVITVNLACFPYNAIWELTIPGKCIDKKTLDVTAAIMAMVTDVTILLLPHRVIWKLHMNTKKKLGVSAIFGLGIFGCVCAAIRVPTVVSFYDSPDVVYNYSSVAFWAAAEFTTGMLILGAPSTPKLVRHLRESPVFTSLKSWTGSRARTNRTSYPHGGVTMSAKPSVYQKIDSHSALPLAKLRDPSSDQQHAESLVHGDRDIVRTTHFTATENHEFNFADDGYIRHHPWAEKRY
ncbi:hypothetical protein F5B20DRAFT_579172 [Whalleya microplaca]|nr:hypothetical protein F5B20DRAFT_579172 [Whalleya microplaca]